MKSLIPVKFVICVVILTILSAGIIYAQVGGPYTADANTMLLLHFDGDLSNASQYSADGVFHGDPSNFYFLANPITDLGQCLRIDNDSQSDQAYITVADTEYLDLTGDWTIEGWINIFTFGEGSTDWRWVPRLVIKTGDEVFWRPNYFVEMWGSTRFFSCGYQAASQDQWPQSNTPDNTMVPGQWYHLAFIRDTSRHILLTIVHNANRELVAFSCADYLSFGAADPTPITTDQPVHIGYAGGGTDSYLDGFVDEIRISNVAREFPIPPIISNVTKLPNQESSVPAYTIGANIYTLCASASIASAKLYYDVGSGWQSVAMTTVSGDSMMGTIPQQPSGSIIKYYLEAVDNNGLKFSYPQDAGWEAAEYYSFGIYTPMTQTLELTFEEGAGVPKDYSSYNHTVTLVGNPTYITYAPSGNYSIYLEGDSSYLEIDSPFLTSETFCVDFWFNASEIENYCRILNRPGSPPSWSTNNYQVRFNDAQQLQAISDGSVSFTTDITMEINRWYHVLYEVQKAYPGDTVAYYGAFLVKDESDQELFMDYAGFDVMPLQSTAPLRIGKAGTSTGPEAYPPFFHGSYDEVKIYNYPAAGLLADIVKPIPVGGPYTADDNTMLLLHFDGDLTNESQYSADGEYHGEASNFYFLANPITDLGQCLRIDNDSQSDQAYVTVADTEYLDLTEDWTIEGWINIFTFGEGSTDWRWVPRLVIKTGDEVFWRPNYFVEMWGSTRFFSCGYHTASQDQWPQANSPDNTMVPGQWYHLAFIRDTSRHLLLTIIHDANRELVAFSCADYLSFGAADPTPITTDQPVHIGYAGGGGDSYLDGFVDEIRISNVAREFPIPPIISNVTKLPNQESSVPAYTIGANIYTLCVSASIASAKLYYDVGSGWQSVAMTTVSGDSMMGTIPQQPSGSIIKYYLEAVDNNGLKFSYPQDAGWEAAEYYSFGIYTPNTQTLELTFEEGSGIPQDGSSYGHTITLVGNPVFSTDAKNGSYSMYLEGDSSYLEVDSPFLTSETFAVDSWVKMDTIKTYCRILNRPGSAASWSTNNYQIRTNDVQQLQAISDGSVTFTTDITIEPNKWYHVIFEVQKAPAGDTCVYYGAFQLNDENDQELFMDYAGFDVMPLQSTAPLRIGKAGTSTGPEAYPPFFKGYYDDVKIYNYPGVGLLKGIVAVEPNLSNNIPLKFELSQNYPNPFNPSTEIRFTIPNQQRVKLTVYNLLGEEVKILVDETIASGKYQVNWDGTNKLGAHVTSGIYFYELKSNDIVKVRKMLLLR